MRSEELAKLTRVGYPTPSEASLRHDEVVGDDALGVPTLLSAHSCDIRTMFGAL